MQEVDTVVLVFSLGERLFGLPVRAVRQVVLATDVTPVPGAAGAILGMVDYRGDILPVIDMRAKCDFPSRETFPEDRFVILETRGRIFALRVDQTRDVMEVPARDIVNPEGIVGALPGLVGIIRHAAGLVSFYDPDVMFAPECEIVAAMIRTAVV